jgi:hypothetical protein
VRIRTSGPFPPYAFGPGAVRDVGGVSE